MSLLELQVIKKNRCRAHLNTGVYERWSSSRKTFRCAPGLVEHLWFSRRVLGVLIQDSTVAFLKLFSSAQWRRLGCSLCSARTSWDLPWAHRQVFSRCLITMGLGYTLALNWASVICWRLLLWCSWVQELVGMICEGKFMVIVESGCIPLLCSLYKLKISEKYSRRVTIFQ